MLRSNGDGTLAAPVFYATSKSSTPHPGVGAQPESIVAVDVDGDGHLDLATANAFTDDVSVLLGGATAASSRPPS